MIMSPTTSTADWWKFFLVDFCLDFGSMFGLSISFLRALTALTVALKSFVISMTFTNDFLIYDNF